jgi:hypothetical protein
MGGFGVRWFFQSAMLLPTTLDEIQRPVANSELKEGSPGSSTCSHDSFSDSWFLTHLQPTEVIDNLSCAKNVGVDIAIESRR